jgi:hypothetical protein
MVTLPEIREITIGYVPFLPLLFTNTNILILLAQYIHMSSFGAVYTYVRWTSPTTKGVPLLMQHNQLGRYL